MGDLRRNSLLSVGSRCMVLIAISIFYRFAELKTTSSTIGGGRGCNIFVPVLGGNGTKIAPTEDILDQSPGQMR